VVVGGGVAGLAAARAALTSAERSGRHVEVTLLEASDRLGGKIMTEVEGGIPLEWGPDSFLSEKPRGRGLAEELGLEVVPPGPAARRHFLYLKGELRPYPAGLVMGIPTGLGPLVDSVRVGLVGPRAAARAAIEPLLPRLKGQDPSVGEVIRKRLGKQVADRLVAPLTTSVLGADPDQLSMASAMPRLAAQRSLVLAMARAPRASGRPVFYTIRGGMQLMVDRLAEELRARGADLRTGSTVTRLHPDHGRVDIELADGSRIEAGGVILAAQAFAAAPMLASDLPEVARALAASTYRSSAVMFLRFERDAVGHPMDGSGYLVSPEDDLVVSAVSWLPSKWPHTAEADPDSVWMRAVVTDRHRLEKLDDDAIRRVGAEEISVACRAARPPVEVRMMRWDRSLPVYISGHRARMDAARAALPARISLAGAAYEGFGVPDCIRTGEAAAESLVRSFFDPAHPL
jgi:oxygen-dependent protoporphyrinogen oxidase